MKEILIYILLMIGIILALSTFVGATEHISINIKLIAKLESENNPLIYNSSSGAVGLCQITPICLEDYNKYSGSIPMTMEDMWDKDNNLHVAKWYINKRIPQILKSEGLKDSTFNRLVSYNSGWTKVRDNVMPSETLKYIMKYIALGGEV